MALHRLNRIMPWARSQVWVRQDRVESSEWKRMGVVARDEYSALLLRSVGTVLAGLERLACLACGSGPHASVNAIAE
jgi:hypothetical protein